VSLEPEELTAQIFGDRAPKTSKARIFDWFLMVLACMIPLDVAVRRVQVDFSWLRALFRREEQKESGATMGALLEKSQAVRTAMEATQTSEVTRPAAQPKRRVVLPTKSTTKSPESKADKSEPKAADAKAPSIPDGSTTSRLLQMKRKREEEKEE